MDLHFTDWELSILKKISDSSASLGIQSWLIGGFVRDRILGRENKNDLDIVCLGDGIELAQEVAKQFRPTPKVDFYKNFGTAHITSPPTLSPLGEG